jgi:hypothetical protein
MLFMKVTDLRTTRLSRAEPQFTSSKFVRLVFDPRLCRHNGPEGRKQASLHSSFFTRFPIWSHGVSSLRLIHKITCASVCANSTPTAHSPCLFIYNNVSSFPAPLLRPSRVFLIAHPSHLHFPYSVSVAFESCCGRHPSHLSSLTSIMCSVLNRLSLFSILVCFPRLAQLDFRLTGLVYNRSVLVRVGWLNKVICGSKCLHSFWI